MKKESTSRRKKLPLLLGALLIISVAAYGTRAYFSDSATQQADIQLSLGNLDIESVDSKWIYTPENDNVNSALLAGGSPVTINMDITPDAKNITNVQPGDQFERIFKFKNEGSLEQVVTVNNTVSSVESSIFKVDFKRIEANEDASTNENTAKIKKDGFVRYKMIISVKTDNDFNDSHNTKVAKSIENDTIFSALSNDKNAETLLENAITVTAKQTNDVSK